MRWMWAAALLAGAVVASAQTGRDAGVSGAEAVELNREAIGAAYSLSAKGGMKVGNEAYALVLAAPQFYRHTEADVNKIAVEATRSMPDPLRPAMQRMMSQYRALAKVRKDENGQLAADAVHEKVLGEDGEEVRGGLGAFFNTAAPRNSKYFSGKFVQIVRGVFWFGNEFTPWPLSGRDGNCMVEAKNALFVTDSSALFGNESTRIRSSQCWLSIGAYEMQGEAEFTPAGLRLLPGARYRPRSRQ